MDQNKTKNAGSLAVITGASSGIGYELASVFAQNGFDLVICAEDDGIADAGNSLRRFGTDVEIVQADLATREGADLLHERVLTLGKPVDSLALNAGVGVGGDFIETDWDAELNLLNLNVVSLVYLAKIFVKDMVTRDHGRILFTSSIAGEMPGPHYAVYAASKAFVQSFSEALRDEVKDHGIVITALQPGATDTNFFARADMLNTKAGQGKKDDPATVALDGFNALMKGKDHVVAGSFKNKVQTAIAKIISDPQGAKMQGSSTKPLPPQQSRH